jgi:hypothetical protein
MIVLTVVCVAITCTISAFFGALCARKIAAVCKEKEKGKLPLCVRKKKKMFIDLFSQMRADEILRELRKEVRAHNTKLCLCS